jgi:arylsulfatase A-like enzyme/tetratricopeptide (TPR) repeat protein
MPTEVTRKRRVLPFLAIALVLAAAVAVLLLLSRRPEPASARESFRSLIAKSGIDKPNIVLITLDTTRADHLPIYGYSGVRTPGLDRLARRGLVFEQCVTATPFTLPSHCSIMTGLYPTYHGVRINGNTALAEQHETMAKILGRRGYECGAFIGAFVLDGRWGLKQGFAEYNDDFNLSKYKQLDLGLVQKPSQAVVDEAIAWLAQRRSRPFFAWLHLYDPHVPYDPPEPFRSEYGGRGSAGLYDGEIAAMDAQIGRFSDWLDENGLAENTILVLVGDHGEGLGEHGESTHGYYVYDYVLHVPLLIVTPFSRLQGRRCPQQVRTVDLLPTVEEMAGITPAPGLHGRSLLPLFFGQKEPEERPAYSESMAPQIQYGWSPLYSLRRYPFKYIDAPRAEFYDLADDPGENSDIHLRQSSQVREFKKTLERVMADTGRGAPKAEAADLDQETMRRLATLGYVGSVTSVVGAKAGLADPKDKIAIFEAVAKSTELTFNEKFAEAAELLEGVLKKDPEVIQARLVLSNAYQKLRRNEEAKEQLDAVLKQDPNQIQALVGMAGILRKEGRFQDVISLCQKALQVESNSTQALELMGNAYMDRKEFEHALPPLQKAATLQAKMTQYRQNLAACFIFLKQYAQAQTILDDIVREFPKFPLVHFNLGVMAEEEGEPALAESRYRKEIEANPGLVPARFNLGKLLLKNGDFDAYMEQMNEIVRLAPEMAEGRLFLARGQLRDPQADLAAVQANVEIGLKNTRAPDLQALGWFLMADIFDRRHLPDKVQEALRRANHFKALQEKNR